MARKRGQGEGSITKRSDGRWMAQLSAGYEFDPVSSKNKRKRVTLYGKTRKEVQEKLTKLLAELQQGANIVPEKTTFEQWLDKWLELYYKPNTKEGTWGMYEEYARLHIKPALGRILLNKITTADIQQFINEKKLSGRLDGKGGLSYWSIVGLFKVINLSLKQATIEGYIRQNPATYVRLPKKEQSPIIPLNEEEISAFLSSIQDNRFYAAFVLELATGIRRGELLGLKWEDLDTKESHLQINRSLIKNKSLGGGFHFAEPKTTASKRKIYVAPFAMDALKQHRKKQIEQKLSLGEDYVDNDLIFCHENGEPLHPITFYNHFRSALEKSGLRHVTFHTLRHSVATVLLKNGVQLKTVQELLGHVSIATTGDIYSHVLDEVKQEAANVLNRLMPETGKNLK